MKKTAQVIVLLLFAFSTYFGISQDLYFPERNEAWKAAEKNQFSFNETKLQTAVDFAKENEYSGSRDLRRAILKGFQHEPFHEILGPTKKRG